MSFENEKHYGDAIEPIAIIGMSCRFPGQVSSPEEFWDMLSNGRSGHCAVPESRFNASAFCHPDHDRKGAIQPKSGFFMDEDVSLFDAPFFSITAKEAMAGVPIEALKGTTTSVYTGVMTNDYELISASDMYNLPLNAASGTSRAMLSNRVSWFFDLRGPSLTLDTACSSSVYALHLACQSVRLGESSQALVAGVNLLLHPATFSQFSNMHMISPDGISHTFDDRGNGYGRGEAVGAVLIKPLSQALKDGDVIRAVIRGTGANQDGKTPGITMPSKDAQASLIRETYRMAGLGLDETAYFEAHGTGTKIGDPIELSAIASCFSPTRDASNPLYVGSAKTNVGHTEGMAGITALIKTVLSLENAVLPKLVGFQTLNPKLLLDNWKLALPLETMSWPTKGLRRASVNCFGFGGSNAHVILDDAGGYLRERGLSGRCYSIPDQNHEGSREAEEQLNKVTGVEEVAEKEEKDSYKLLVFSMQDQNGLKRLSERMSAYLSSSLTTPPSLLNLAHTLSARRTHFPFRSFCVAPSISHLLSPLGLKTLASKQTKRQSKSDKLIFVFTGQGAQWALMGRELLSNPEFKASIDRSQVYLDELGCEWDAAELLCDPGPRINIAEHCQPICTVLQVALVDMLRTWGIRPAATVGHSSGEIGAAYAAGGITHRDAIKISYFRGYYCGQIQIRLKDKKGAMLAAGLTPAEAQTYIDQVAEGTVVVGCINSPTSVTLSGDIGAISYLEERIKWDGKFARKLRVEVAYHSSHTHSVSADFLVSLGKVDTQEEFEVPMFSSVTTEKLEHPSDLGAEYWITNMVSPVRFSEAVSSLLAYTTVNPKTNRKMRVNWSAAVEIGPHEALKGPFNQCLAASEMSKSNNALLYTSMVKRDERADKSTMEAVGLLWALGHSIDISKVNGERGGEVMPLKSLPPYPWQHSKGFWHEPASSASTRLSSRPRTDLLGIAVDNQNAHEPRWRNYLRLSENPWMRDHAITGTVLYPAAGMIIMAVEAALEIASIKNRAIRGVELHDLHFDRGLVIPDVDEAVETSLSLRPHETLADWFHWTVYSVPPGGSWTKHCFGLLSLVYVDNGEEASSIQRWTTETQRYNEIKGRASKTVDTARFYSQLRTIGMGYGPTFTNMTSASAVEGSHLAHGTFVIPDTKTTMPHEFEYPNLIHPATLDAIFHLVFVALFEGNPMPESAIPVTAEKFYIAVDQPSGAGSEFVGFADAIKVNDRDSLGSLVVSDNAWSSPKVLVTNLVVRKVSSPSSNTSSVELNQVPRRIAHLQWKEDVDLLSRTAVETLIKREAVCFESKGLTSPAAQTAVWFDLACHKSATLRLLAVVNSEFSAKMAVELLSLFGPVAGQSLRFDSCVVAATTEDLLNSLKDHEKLQGLSVEYELINATEDDKAAGISFDLVLADIRARDENTVAYTTARLIPDGKLISLRNIRPDFASNTPLPQKLDKIVAHITTDNSELLITTNSLPTKFPETPKIYLIEQPSPSPSLAALKTNLSTLFSRHNISLESKLLSEVKSLSKHPVICLLEAEDPLVMNWTSEEFSHFQDLIFSQSYIMWITRGGILECGEASLEFAPTTGLLRTVRVEVPRLILSHVDLSPAASLGEIMTAEMVFDAFQATSKPRVDGGLENELELVESKGSFFIPRALADKAFDEELNAHSETPVAINGYLSERDSSLKLVHSGSALGYWTIDSEMASSLGDDEVEVKTTHLALSGADIDAVSGAWQDSAGRAASGTITRIGLSVSDFSVGDEVYFPTRGGKGFKTRLRQHQKLVSKVRGGLSLADAASLPTAFLTAQHCLTDVARIEVGEQVLIHLIASAESQAAVQLSLALGAKLFVTVNSIAERSWLRDNYKVPDNHIFDSTSKALALSLAAATNGRGFDVIISDHEGVSLRQASMCLAESGHFVDISQKVRTSDLSTDIFQKNISFSTVDIQKLSQAKFYDLFQRTAKMLQEGSNLGRNPTPEMFSISSLDAAQEFLISNPGSGAVVSFDDNALVPILPSKPLPVILNPSATYLIAGGLGALGLTIAENMVDHGARHLVLLSRSGVTNKRQREILKRLRSRECVVDTPLCDVTNEMQVENLMGLSREKSWSIKGLVQCATVLRDSVFENMTFEKWLGSTQPKIKGTWNLHKHLLDDLDFFVVLSSISGIIGNPAQANYAAGNTYEDAIAHYRNARGLKATTLNVGLVADASHFSAESTVEDYLKRFGHLAPCLVTDREMQIALEAAMRGTIADHGVTPVQLLVGINNDIPRGEDGLNPWSKDRKFDHRVQRNSGSPLDGVGAKSLAEELKATKTAREAIATVEYSLRTYVAAAMTASPEEIDAEKPLYSFGIDSLKAIQVKNWVFKELKCDISVFDILSPVPVGQLASSIARKSSLISSEVLAMIEQEGL